VTAQSPPPDAPPPPPPAQPSGSWSAPSASPLDRFRVAYARRDETDYYFSNIGLDILFTVITFGIYGLVVFYQLMRRMRDHNRRRLELLESATDFAWQQAGSRGIAEELRPNFERISTNLGALRDMTTDFREPAVWLVIVIAAAVVASIGFVPWMVALVLIDGDLVKHDQNEGAVEAELSAVFARMGQNVPAPDPARQKGKQNYPGRIVATVFTCLIYGFWWQANAMRDGNLHFEWNWPWEDAVAGAVQALAPAA
jgi:hypothetical protein